MKIAITTSSFGVFDKKALKLCEDNNITYVLNPYGRALSEDEAVELYKGCIGVVAGTEPITQKVMLNNPSLKVISRCGVGTDNIDKVFANENNITVLCTPNAPTKATAEQTITLMLCLLRHTSHMDRDMRNNIWKKRMGNLLSEKKVGIIGFGRIGRTVAQFLRGFNCDIAYHDPFINEDEQGFPNYSLDELLAWADIVTLHCSKEKDAPPILNKEKLSLMRKGTWLINAARADLIEEDALIDALTLKHLKGAALDVFHEEPYKGILQEMENVLLTPHASSYAEEARIEMETQAMLNLISKLKHYAKD